MSMARIHIVETKLRGTALSSVGAYPCQACISLNTMQPGIPVFPTLAGR